MAKQTLYQPGEPVKIGGDEAIFLAIFHAMGWLGRR
jgi:hypothetical protein